MGGSVVDTYLVSSLKRVHDQAAESLRSEGISSSETIAERFNQVLDDFQEAYPDKDRLAEIEPVEGTKASMRRPGTNETSSEDLREIKLRTEQIADLFELDVADFEEVDDTSEMRPIILEQNTTVSQETAVSQSVDFTDLTARVDQAMMGDDDAEELKSLIQEFKDELEDEETDGSQLRELASQAKQYGMGVGTQVAAKLTMAGLEAGYDLIP
jgi:hypothetical protein